MLNPFSGDFLRNKVAFITGGSSGINQRIAETYARHGAAVAIMGRDLEKARRAAAKIQEYGGQAMGLSADVRDYEATRRAMAEAFDRFGHFDIVVAGAAGNFVAPALGMSANAFRTVIEIDLIGTFNTARAAHEYLNKPGAAIIAISAVQSSMPTAMQAHVCSAKAGIDMLVRTLAVEWGPAGIRCVGIAPGPVADTEGMKRLAPNGQKSWDALLAGIPSGRAAQRDEIASLAAFLASDAGTYINGTVIKIDGGQTAVGSAAFGNMLTESVAD